MSDDATSSPSPASEADRADGGPPLPTAPVQAPKRNHFGIIAPFVPIALAVTVALVARHYQQANGTDKAGTAATNALTKGHDLSLDSLAPDFSLDDAHRDDGDEKVTLSILADRSPVLIVFYLGYNCPKCVGHLREIDNHLQDFAKAGLQVLAISPDTPRETRDSESTYGEFHFPLLSDRDLKVFRVYGLLDEKGNPLHGAFIIDKNRRVRFVSPTDHPYDDIDNLLAIGNELQKPAAPATKPH